MVDEQVVWGQEDHCVEIGNRKLLQSYYFMMLGQSPKQICVYPRREANKHFIFLTIFSHNMLTNKANFSSL